MRVNLEKPEHKLRNIFEPFSAVVEVPVPAVEVPVPVVEVPVPAVEVPVPVVEVPVPVDSLLNLTGSVSETLSVTLVSGSSLKTKTLQ